MKPIETSFRNSPLSLTKQHLVKLKGNSKKWFDSVVSEGINNRDKIFTKFKKSRLSLDQEDYKKPRYEVKKLIAEKKKNYFKTKLTENIGKTKEL